MALTDQHTIKFQKSVSDGMAELCAAVIESKSRNHEPLLVAVSRRMPHLIFWYKHSLATEKEKEILNSVEIITEIALPFIDFHPKKDYLDIVIVDDVVESGRTIEYVADLARKMLESDEINVFVFFCAKKYAKLLSLKSCYKKTAIVYEYLNSEKESISLFISAIISATLPIDVTYPLLYVDNSNEILGLKEIALLFRDPKSKEEDCYSSEVKYGSELTIGDSYIKEGDINESFTCLLPSELSGTLNNDFAKIRTYRRFGGIIVVPYAPNILSDADLCSPDLFENDIYSKVWNLALKKIPKTYFVPYGYLDYFDPLFDEKEAKSNRSYRSMMTVANYLYSLSSFNRIVRTSPEADSMKYSIRKEDLCLVFGDALTDEIYSLLCEILRNRLVSPKVHKRLKVDSTFIPDLYDQEYTISKYMVVENSDLDLDLTSIFENAGRQSSRLPAFLNEDLEYGVEGIMESFESLEKALMIKEYSKKVDINRWIDRKIDEGKIVSRYAYSFDDNDVRYWRRFFRKSTSLKVK